jgi:hypothetical protein
MKDVTDSLIKISTNGLRPYLDKKFTDLQANNNNVSADDFARLDAKFADLQKNINANTSGLKPYLDTKFSDLQGNVKSGIKITRNDIAMLSVSNSDAIRALPTVAKLKAAISREATKR